MSLILLSVVIVRGVSSMTIQPSFPNREHCEVLQDCSAGSPASVVDFSPSVSSPSACRRLCRARRDCSFYVYNYSPSSPNYRMCLLTEACSRPRPGDGEWLSGKPRRTDCSSSSHNTNLWTRLRSTRSFFKEGRK